MPPLPAAGEITEVFMLNRFASSLTCASIVTLFLTANASAQPQTTAQQKCLNKMNKDGVAVAKTQGKENIRCVKDNGNGLYVDPVFCFLEDPKGKLSKAAFKTDVDDGTTCTARRPSFGYTGAGITVTVAFLERIFLVADIFEDPDLSFASCGSDPAACKCQQKVWKRVEGAADATLKEFVTCKKAALKAGASSSTALANCLTDPSTPGSVAADTKGKLASAAAKVTAEVVKTCDGAGVTEAFPTGDCATLSGSDLGTCLNVNVQCRACRIASIIDGLAVDCDLFDDGTVNQSCEVCGNGACGFEEDSFICPSDCGCTSAPASCGTETETAGECFCDPLCFDEGDCCADVCDVCTTLGPCAATCGDGTCNLNAESDVSCPADCGCAADPGMCGVGDPTQGSCFCDAACFNANDCCVDVCDVCTTLKSCP